MDYKRHSEQGVFWQKAAYRHLLVDALLRVYMRLVADGPAFWIAGETPLGKVVAHLERIERRLHGHFVAKSRALVENTKLQLEPTVRKGGFLKRNIQFAIAVAHLKTAGEPIFPR